MRVFIYTTNASNRMRVNIAQCMTSKQLLVLIADLLKYPMQSIIVKIKTQNKNFRIIQGWPLKVYPLYNGSNLFVQLIDDNETNIDDNEILIPNKTFQTYFNKKFNFQFKQNINIQSNLLQMTSQLLKLQNFNINKYFDKQLCKFLQAIQQQKLQKLTEIYNQQIIINQIQITNEKYDEILFRKQNYIINEIGQCGRNALHWAIQLNNQDIVIFLLLKGCNVNIETLDGYTPLQLAISLGLEKITQILLEQPKLDLQYENGRGSALHCAVIRQDIKLTTILLRNKINIDIRNNQNKTALQISQLEQIKQLIKAYKNKKLLPIPNIIKGNVIMQSRIRNRECILSINPYSDEYIIYNNNQIIFHENVHDIQRIQFHQKNINGLYWINILSKTINKYGIQTIQNGRYWVKTVENIIQYIKNNQLNTQIDKQQYMLEYITNTGQIQFTTQLNKQLQSVALIHLNYEESKQQNHIQQAPIVQQINPFEQEIAIQPKYLARNTTIHNKKLIDTSFRKTTYCQTYMQPIEEIQDKIQFKDFEVVQQLGKGSVGIVMLARYISTNKQYAMKVCNKKTLQKKKKMKYVINQNNILKKIDHPFIITLYYSFQTPTNLYFILQYCSLGNLNTFINQKGVLSETTARFICGQLILAIQYLHNNGILYLNMRPQNILLNQDGYVRIKDFGVSKQTLRCKEFIDSGTEYLSPEMLQRQEVGIQTDIYGIGCVLYEMLMGQSPFYNSNSDTLMNNILHAKLKFSGSININTKSLIIQLLQRNPLKRIKLQDIKVHSYFKGYNWNEIFKGQQIPIQIKDKIKIPNDKQSKCNFHDRDYVQSDSLISRIAKFSYIKQTN